MNSHNDSINNEIPPKRRIIAPYAFFCPKEYLKEMQELDANEKTHPENKIIPDPDSETNQSEIKKIIKNTTFICSERS